MTKARSRHEHLYVYAIVAGLPRTRALAGLPTLPDGSIPRVVALDDEMSLVVANVPSEIYNAAALEPRLSDVDWVSRCGAAHHAVADALSESHVVLPFRFFTLFSTEAKAVATLQKSRSRIAKALARVKGRQEWVLRIGKPNPARREAPPGQSRRDRTSGTGFLRAKAQARQQQTDRNARVAEDAAHVFEILRGISDEAASRPIPPGANLLLDAAFLVPKRRTATLQRTLTDAAAGLLREGCPVSLTGPWPPYSFASLDGNNG